MTAMVFTKIIPEAKVKPLKYEVWSADGNILLAVATNKESAERTASVMGNGCVVEKRGKR